MEKGAIGDGDKHRRAEDYWVNEQPGVGVPVAAISMALMPRAMTLIRIAS